MTPRSPPVLLSRPGSVLHQGRGFHLWKESIITNVERGEISLDVPFDKDRKDHYVLKFSNAGHRAMEDFLGMESSEILAKINDGRLGARIVTGLFWGATRKFHRNDFPSVADVDDYMDEIDDEADDASEAGQNILVALVAAYTRSNPSDIEAALMGEEAEQPSTNGNAAPKGRGKKKPPAKKAPAKKAEPVASGESS